MHIRASSLPLFMRCPGSYHQDHDTLLVTQDSDAASLGTAAHLAAASMVSGCLRWDELPAIARDSGVDAEELRMLAAMAASLWAEVSESFPDPLTELPLSHQEDGLLVTGHVDILSEGPTVARVADWKFGYRDHDYGHQMRAYAALVLLANSKLSEATSTILWVRDREAQTITMTQVDARLWLEEVRSACFSWDGIYHVGPQCEWCPRSTECPAARAMVRRTVEAFIPTRPSCLWDIPDGANQNLSAMTADQVVALLDSARMVARYAEAAQKVIKDWVKANGDVVGSSQRLTLEETHPRELDPLLAFPVLEANGFGDEDLAQVMKLSISKAESLVAKRAGKGNGAAAVLALSEALEAAGAIQTKTTHRLVQKRVP